ncbi:MAG: DUF4274 domain-containing protein [Hyphomicrobium sp.]|nr:DUF4274 domain-containing protein [Hyphomicrobium sp.]
MIEWLKANGPREWHCVATSWNWDMYHEPLHWILDQPNCDRGTAVTLLWLADPTWYLQWSSREEVMIAQPYNIEGFDMVTKIVKNWERGFIRDANLFRRTTILQMVFSYWQA